jgi:CRISPR-associated protein Csb1
LQLSDGLDLIATGAAVRRIRRMRQVGRFGDKLFPPTYPTQNNNDRLRHGFEFRQTISGSRRCVMIDSLRSQANRMENALSHLGVQRRLDFLLTAVDFSDRNDLAVIGTVDLLLKSALPEEAEDRG